MVSKSGYGPWCWEFKSPLCHLIFISKFLTLFRLLWDPNPIQNLFYSVLAALDKHLLKSSFGQAAFDKQPRQAANDPLLCFLTLFRLLWPPNSLQWPQINSVASIMNVPVLLQPLHCFIWQLFPKKPFFPKMFPPPPPPPTLPRWHVDSHCFACS